MLTVNPPVCSGCQRVSGSGNIVNNTPVHGRGGISYSGAGNDILPLITILTALNVTLDNINKTLKVIVETRSPFTDA